MHMHRLRVSGARMQVARLRHLAFKRHSQHNPSETDLKQYACSGMAMDSAMQVDGKCIKRPTLYCAGVSYLLAPKAHLAFGEAENKYEVDFEETNTGGDRHVRDADERNDSKGKR